MGFTLIYYYLPEDNDDQDIYNAFGIEKSTQDLRLEDIQQHFPVEGSYHFRFKCILHSSPLWMDIKPGDGIPLYQGKVIMKVTRISWAGSAPAPMQMPSVVKPAEKEESLLHFEPVASTFDSLFP